MTACARCGFDADTPVGARWSMTLAVSVPSQNEAHNKGARRVKVGTRIVFKLPKESRRYKAFREHVLTLVTSERNRQRIPTATAARRVTMTRLIGPGDRAYDYGNLVGGLKGALDAMVLAGLLVDDSPKWVEERYGQEKAAADGLRIEIEEVP